MSEFKELIKSFSKSREYVRDFFVYGFKTREEFDRKSGRTYDNERRRIESWLFGFVQVDYTSKGKNISLSIDSNLLDVNPLYRVWKTKSFTKNDLMLHFFLLDSLNQECGRTIDQLTDFLLTNYNVLFELQMVRRKCNEYVREGLLRKEKIGRKVLYYKNPPFSETIIEIPLLLEAIRFYQTTDPFGFLGNTILDNLCTNNKFFRVKHSFLVHTLEDEILLQILSAIHQKYSITFHIKSNRNDKTTTQTAIPLQIFSSTRTGRRFLCCYLIKLKRFFCYRLDYIKKVQLLTYYPELETIRKNLKNNYSRVWGVSFQNSCHTHLHYVKLILRIEEQKESFILERLKREGKNGSITKTGENTFTYVKEGYDIMEMIPWIRTFIGRIIDIESNHPNLKKTFQQDLFTMYKMYDII